MLFVLIVMIDYGINTLFSLKLPRGLCYTMMIYVLSLTQAILRTAVFTLCMDGSKNGLKAFVSLNRDWLEGTELKLQVSVPEYQVSKTSPYLAILDSSPI